MSSSTIQALEASDTNAVARNVTITVNRGQGNHQGCAVGHNTFTQRAKENVLFMLSANPQTRMRDFFLFNNYLLKSAWKFEVEEAGCL